MNRDQDRTAQKRAYAVRVESEHQAFESMRGNVRTCRECGHQRGIRSNRNDPCPICETIPRALGNTYIPETRAVNRPDRDPCEDSFCMRQLRARATNMRQEEDRARRRELARIALYNASHTDLITTPQGADP